jgi:drug/metabolite transporter (DMT)-like permease
MDNGRKRAILYLIITAVLWSTGGLFIKLVDLSPLAIAGARSGIAAVVMLLYMSVRHMQGKSSPADGKFKIHLDKINILGACSYASLLIMFVSANKLTTSANAILLQFTAPIWAALFSGWFLKEKVQKSDWLSIAAVMAGMVLFFMGDMEKGNMAGNFIAVLSGIAMAGVVLFLKLQRTGSPVEITLLGNIITFAVGLPFLFQGLPGLKGILALIVLGVFQLGISYILYTASVKHVSAVEAILIPVLEPILNPVWVFLAAGESPGIYAVIGGFIVIGAIISRSLYGQKE